MVLEEVEGGQGETISLNRVRLQLETRWKFRAVLPLSKTDFLDSLSVCRIIFQLLFPSFPVAVHNHFKKCSAIFKTLCLITQVDFWGGHDFVCTNMQCSTVEIGLGVGQCWGPTSHHPGLLQPGSDAHEDVAHATRTPRDPSQPHFTCQSEFPEASLQYKSFQVVHGEGRYLKNTFLLLLNAGVSTAPGFCNAGAAE